MVFKVHVNYDRNTNSVKIIVDKKAAEILTGLLYETEPATEHFRDVRNKLIELIEKRTK